jgi:hypothetical protein
MPGACHAAERPHMEVRAVATHQGWLLAQTHALQYLI